MKIGHFSPLKCMFCNFYACYEELPVCPECAHKLQALLTTVCRTCGKSPSGCQCGGNIRFMFFYGSAESKGLIYLLKHHGDKRVIKFLAEMTAESCGIDPSSYDGVAYVPRLKKNKRRYGYDQSKELAKAISKKLDLPLLHILERVGGKEQKLLSYSQRIRNIRRQYRLKYIPKEKYKKLLLVDDVFTTGATVSVCADILRKDAAKAVVPITVAKTNFLKDRERL